MKNTKKIVALALAVVMLMAMFAGCAKKEHAHIESDPTEGHTHTEAPTEEATEAPTEAEEEVQYASVVYVSVNPLFAIYFDAEGNVVNVTAENDDGAALAVDMDAIMGMSAADAVEALLNTIKDAGYFADGEHNIELTFYGEAESAVADIAVLGELEKAICEAAEKYVADKGITATVNIKVSPAAAPVKMEDIKKLPAPPKPSKPTEPSEDSEEPTKAPEPDKDKKPTKPTEGTKPTKPTEPKPTKPTEPKPTTKPTEPKPTTPSHKHSYKSEVVKPTCTAKGYTKYTCECGDSYKANETDELDHDYKEEIVKATYETGGYTKYTCKVCGHYYEGSHTAPLYKPTEPTTPPTTKPSEEPTEPKPTEKPTEPKPTEPEVKCSYCGGPHYLYECAKAKEDAATKPTEARKCVYCGDTDCPYLKTGDMTKCKAYDEKKDPTKYCRHCGKAASKCTRWLEDTECPKCGKLVPARTCHSC